MYAALLPSLVLVLTAASGAAIMLEGRLLPPAFHAERYTLEVGTRRAAVEPIVGTIERRYGIRPHQLSIPGNPVHADQYRLRANSGERDATVLVDPYTGAILERAADFRTPLSRTLRDFHLELLSGSAGAWLVGGSTAILLLTSLTGIVLVIPALKRLGLRALIPRRRMGARCWNYRFHHLLGLAFAPVFLVIAASGCYLAFEPVQQAVARLVRASPGVSSPTPMAAPIVRPETRALPIDAVLELHGVLEEPSQWDRVRIEFPQEATDPLRIERRAPDSEGTDEVFFVDPYSGERIGGGHGRVDRRPARSPRSLIRSLHFGTVLGSWTEAFWLAACCSLPAFVASGTAIWWSRRRRGASAATGAEAEGLRGWYLPEEDEPG